MSLLSYKAMKIYREAVQRAKETKKGNDLTGNLLLLSKVAKVLLVLEINVLTVENKESISETYKQLNRIREHISYQSEDVIPGAVVETFLELLLSCLAHGIVPDSCILLGSEYDMSVEHDRLECELRLCEE